MVLWVVVFFYCTQLFLVSSFQIIGLKSVRSASASASSSTTFTFSTTLTTTKRISQRTHLTYSSFKVNDDDDDDNAVADVKTVIPAKKRRVVRSTPIKNLISLDTPEEFNTLMKKHENDIVVIRFFAPWCKSCASIAPSFHRLARRNPKAIFLDIAATPQNSDFIQSLNVPYVPYGHIYGSSSNALVHEMKISKSDWKVFERKVKNMLQGSCDLNDGHGHLGADDDLPF